MEHSDPHPPRLALQIDNVAPRYALRLDDLREWHVLQLTCVRCRHTAVIYPTHLARRWPGYTRVMDLESKFRCTACGSKDVSWQVCRLPRD